jgi:hypothetical protein
MFRKKGPAGDTSAAVLRGRSKAGRGEAGVGQGAANALARRLQARAEPDTIDLAGPVGFPASTPDAEEPQTSDLQATAARLERFISRDAATGKLYVHPGSGQEIVILCGSAVSAPTELRPGDEIRLGGAIFEYRQD